MALTASPHAADSIPLVVCTHFSEEDYVEFLQDMLPLNMCEAIVVVEPDQFKERLAVAVKDCVQPKVAAATKGAEATTATSE